MHPLVRHLPFCCFILLFATETLGQTEAKLVPSDASVAQRFGRSVAVCGDLLIVGAPADDQLGTDAGSVYVFRRENGNWNEKQKLFASNAAEQDHFGISVACDDTVVVVGAFKSGGRGSVYIFSDVGNSVEEEQIVSPNDLVAGADFGRSVAVRNSRMVVGAPKDGMESGNGLLSGSAFVLESDGAGWGVVQKLTASDGDTSDLFGESVGTHGDVIIVGAPWDGSSTGAAYIFHFDGATWLEEKKLSVDDGRPTDYFGETVSVGDSLIVIGQRGEDLPHRSIGAAYVYTFDGTVWDDGVKVIASDGFDEAEFGTSVSVSAGVVAIGSPGDRDNGLGSGSAYIYQFDSAWEEHPKFSPPNGNTWDYFGSALAIDVEAGLDGTMVVGAYNDQDNGAVSGSVYVYSLADIVSADTPPTAIAADRIDSVFPNPMKHSTSIRISLVRPTKVRIEAFDLLGRRVATVVDQALAIGNTDVTWTANNQPNGVYFLRTVIGGRATTTALVVAR